MKTCIKCGIEKDLSEFSKRSGATDGTRGECKQCHNTRQTKWAKSHGYKYQSEYYKQYFSKKIKSRRKISTQEESIKKVKDYNLNNKKKRQEYYRKKLYNLTELEYLKLLNKQNNKCAICSQTFVKTPHIDHNHITGKIRGLLCHKCNLMLGLCNDNITLLNNAIGYLEYGDL